MKKIYLLVAIVGMSIGGYCQYPYQNTNWYFGNTCALNFSTGNPVNVSGSLMYAWAGCTALTDSSGNLLFYTDGSLAVWDRTNNHMFNGDHLWGGNSSTQSCLIIPKPDSANVYYIFTCVDAARVQGFSYSEVDMSLNSGLGAVTVKNFQLLVPVTEKLCGVRHCNGIDYWVIVHNWNDNAYYSYLVSNSGIAAPVVTHIGMIPSVIEYAGYLKASPISQKLAAAFSYSAYEVELYDFDNSTGILSNLITLPITNDNPYGLAFSPDNSKLYVSGYSNSLLYQYDISSNDSATINASQYLIDTVPGTGGGALLLGPHDKIYVDGRNTNYLGTINTPNVLGSGCNFVSNAVLLNGMTLYGLPNFVNQYNVQHLPPSFTLDTLSGCSPLNVHYTNTNNTASGYLWRFGDGDSSTLTNPTHSYIHSGIDTVTLIAYDSTVCGVFTDSSSQTFYFTVFIPPVQPHIIQSEDTLTITNFTTGLQWYNYSIPMPGDTNPVYVVQHTGCYQAIETDVNGCTTKSDTICFAFTGIPSIYDKQNILIYPNPNDGMFILSHSGIRNYEIEIIDVLGRTIYSQSFNDAKEKETITLPLSNGIYFWEAVNENGILAKGKLVIIDTR